MVKVCVEQFPKTNGFYLDGYLKGAIDDISKAIFNDWDFVALISGRGMLRVGKSVLGQQVGFYATQKINELHKLNNKFTVDNICFTGEELIERGIKAPKYSVLVYDEGLAGLAARDSMKQIVRTLMKFFSEIGQKNLIIIVILPEFFDLVKPLAINRSIFLIDVDWANKFERGYFRFYSWKKKKNLYIKGKKFLDYGCVKSDFYGRFTNFYTIDEKKYRKLKADSLKRFNKNLETPALTKANKQRNACLYLLSKEFNLTHKQISQRLEDLTTFSLARNTITTAISKITREYEV